jgi:hypothetical protein
VAAEEVPDPLLGAGGAAVDGVVAGAHWIAAIAATAKKDKVDMALVEGQ